MRILHTADWHLGRIFYGVHLTDDQAHVLDELPRIIRDYSVEALIIAGDIYDRAVPPPEAVALLDDTLSRIIMTCHIPVFIIAGNHDSADRLAFGSRLLAERGLHIAGNISAKPEPVTMSDKWGKLDFVLLPYAEPPLVRERLGKTAQDHNEAMNALVQAALQKVSPEHRSILCAHAFVTGATTAESERPLSIGGAGTVDTTHFDKFSYVALGHLHRPQSIAAGRIRYPGSLLPYSFSECDQTKSFSIADISGNGDVTMDTVDIMPRRAFRHISGFINDIIAHGKNAPRPNDYLMITLKDREPLLDAMGKLRSVYPNVVHIERPLYEASVQNSGNIDHRSMGDLDLFNAFFRQMTGEVLNEEQKKVFCETVDGVRTEEREVVV